MTLLHTGHAPSLGTRESFLTRSLKLTDNTDVRRDIDGYPVRTFIKHIRDPLLMTIQTFEEYEFQTKDEAISALEDRLEHEERRDELLETIEQAADAIVTKYDLEQEVSRDEMAYDLTLGYPEWICRFIDTGVKTKEGIPALIDEIRDNPINNSQIVLGGMTDRSSACRAASKAARIQQREKNSE